MEVCRSLRLQALCHVQGLCDWDMRSLEELHCLFNLWSGEQQPNHLWSSHVLTFTARRSPLWRLMHQARFNIEKL